MLRKRKNRAWIRTITIALILTMTAWLLPANWQQAEAASLKNPQKGANSITWDCVYFGHYPQSSDGKGGFKNEPIKWRVLSVNGNDAFLLADKNIDGGIPYNEESTAVIWETCTMRKWLNSSFMNKAFSSGEKNAIRTTNVVNQDNPEYGTEGGNNTQDKVFLLSIEEAMKPAYGFPNNDNSTETREAVNTAYAKEQGAWTSNSEAYKGNGLWWLRSPGYSSIYASLVFSDGGLDYGGDNVDDSNYAVRPALHLNLSSNLWSYAGTVSSDGKVEEKPEVDVPEPEVQDNPQGDLYDLDPSKITVKTWPFTDPCCEDFSGTKVEIEGVGSGQTGMDGNVAIKNTLKEPYSMKRITVKKDGYRDYIFYTTLVMPDLVSLFNQNRPEAPMQKKEAGDDKKPYLSSFVHYNDRNQAQRFIAETFQASDVVDFRACGVWNGKKAGKYILYQAGGKSFESKDGRFHLNIGESFAGSSDIYIKMRAADGTETKPERVDMKVPDGSIAEDSGNYVSILNAPSESGWQNNVPFLHNDKLSFDLGKLKMAIDRKGSKVRIMLGRELGKDVFSDAEWEAWKKFCESQPTDLSLSQWRNVLKSDNLTTSWTAGAKVKATGYGWLENDLSKGSSAPLTGGIQVILDASTSFKQQYIVGVVPLYMEQGLGVSGKLEGAVDYNVQSRKFNGDHLFTIKPALSIGGGVGVVDALSVGAKGSASMPVELKFPQGMTGAELKGWLDLNAKVLGFEYTKKLAEGTYRLYPQGKARKAGNGQAVQEDEALYDMSSYTLPLKTKSSARWYGGTEPASSKAKRKKAAANAAMNETLLQTGTSDLTEPVLVQEGNTVLAAFLVEDPSRETIHRTKLVYTLYDKNTGKWSTPAAVSRDGTGDFYPRLTAANGKIAVSWLNYKKNVTDQSSMKEALSSSEICTAVWDETKKTFAGASAVLSSSSAQSYNSAQPCMDADGKITQVGLKNAGADIFGTSGKNSLFMQGTCGGKKISKTFALTQGVSVSYDAAVSGNKVTAAVCVDTDKDTATLADREIYLFSSDGTQKRLTGNKTYDAAPKYARYHGKPALFWYTESGYRILDSAGKQELILKDTPAISENYTVVNGEKQETAIAWSSADAQGIYQLQSGIFDPSSGKWNKQVALSDSREHIFYPSGYFGKDGTMEFLYRKGSTGEAGSLYALQAAPAPDLEVVEAYIKDEMEKPGQKTTVYVGVRNGGTKEASGCSLSVDGQTTEQTARILPGQTAVLEADYAVPDSVYNRQITVKAQTAGDENATNNTYRFTAGYTDASVTVSEESWDSGRIVHATVGNKEAVPARMTLQVRRNTKDGELLATKELGTLKQGELATVDFTYKKDSDHLKSDALYYTVTSGGKEKYENNNYDYVVLKNISAFQTKKSAQTITAKSVTKTYGSKPFKLNAKAKGKLTYKSSNTKVAAVSAVGTVTIKGTGKATITITAAATSNYKAATKKITITVNPKKAALTKVSSPKARTLKATWKKDTKASGYQVVIAQNSKFTKGKKTATVTKNSTTGKTFSKLKKRATYYVKVRAYKTSGKTKLYGAYSSVKKVKIK